MDQNTAGSGARQQNLEACFICSSVVLLGSSPGKQEVSFTGTHQQEGSVLTADQNLYAGSAGTEPEPSEVQLLQYLWSSLGLARCRQRPQQAVSGGEQVDG